MMEKRVLLAAALSALIMMVYAKTLSKYAVPKAQGPTTGASGPADPSATSPPSRHELASLRALDDEESVVFIDSNDLRLELGGTSASVRRVILKPFQDLETGEPLQFGRASPVLEMLVEGRRLPWKLTEVFGRRAEWMAVEENKSYHILYEIEEYKPLLHIKLSEKNIEEIPGEPITVTLMNVWNKGDELGDRYNSLETVLLTEKERPWQQSYLTYRGTQKSIRDVPRGTRVVTLADRYFAQSLQATSGPTSVTILPSENGLIATMTTVNAPSNHQEGAVISFDVYFGSRDYLSLKRSGFAQAFHLGFLGRIGVALIALLNLIANMTHNYGVAIILFSVLISCALSPFTLISMKSMKKMQELKPQIDKIMAKYKGKTQKANLEMMSLYKEHKVSPLGGCLPMLLQFPVLIALFNSISHFVELRGQDFLWIRDLSLPDRMAQLPFFIPLLGNDLNALPIIMTGVMIVQMKASQKRMPQDQSNPLAKAMSGPSMSIVFGLLFYQFPSGLVLYWLTNSLTTLAWYRVARV